MSNLTPAELPEFTPAQALLTCTSPLPALARKGLELFNQQHYFEAHEALELAWRAERGAARELYRGILQVGVGYYHLRRGNYRGAVKLLARSKARLAIFPEWCQGVHVQKLRDDSQRVANELARLGPELINELNPELLTSVEFTAR